jgi:hypothetical protein
MKYSQKAVIEAIKSTHGLLVLAAERLGCSRQTIHNYARRYPAVQAAIDEERERILDLAESRLFEAVARGEAWALQFLLRTLGRWRGYSDRVDGAGGDMVVRVVYEGEAAADGGEGC